MAGYNIGTAGKITLKTLTITPNVDTKVYNGTTAATVSGSSLSEVISGKNAGGSSSTVHVTGNIVRIDLMTVQPQLKSDNGQPVVDISQRIIMQGHCKRTRRSVKRKEAA